MSQRTALLFLCVYATLLPIVRITSIKVRTISHTLPFSTPLIQDSQEHPSARLVYGACDSKEGVYNRNCTLVIETNIAVESLDHLDFCDINILSDNGAKYLYALTDTAAVVQWSSGRNRRFAIVQFHGCRIFYPKIIDDPEVSFNFISAYHEGSFDVLVEDRRKETPCKNGGLCRIIFNVVGDVLESPRRWIDGGNNMIESVWSDDESRLIVDMIHEKEQTYVRVYKAQNTGVIDVFKNYPMGIYDDYSNKISVSTTYQLVTVCALNGAKLTCSQFDYIGVLKVETDLKPLRFSNLHSAKVFNRPGGGFTLLHVDYLENNNNTVDDQFFTIRRFDASTKILKSAKLAQLKCPNEKFNLNKMYVSRDDGGRNFCLSFVCDHRQADGRVDVEVNCFTQKDLEFVDDGILRYNRDFV